MKKYLLLLALVCLLGNRVLAQTNRPTYTTTTEVKETIDFSGWNTHDGNNYSVDAEIVWNDNSNSIQSIHGTNGDGRVIDYTQYPISVGTRSAWGLSKSGTHGGSYLQKYSTSNDYFNITNLQDDDEVTIWGDSGDNGGCRVTSNNTDKNNQVITFSSQNHNEGQVIKMQSDGTLQLQFYGQWSGIRKIEIKRNVDQTTIFDYDPGYEEYDLYDTNDGTRYTLGNDGAGFDLNGQNAKYMEFTNYKLTANNRIALTGNNNDWTFNFGMVPPGNNDEYSYFSICNLREGDRVVISYTNTSDNALILASGKDDNTGNFYYNGSAAFRDVDNNGVFNDGDSPIEAGAETTVNWSRDEGWIASQQQERPTPVLKYTNAYVITQDGHLDLAFRKLVYNNGNDDKHTSRIVKIKIYSDHQAMMVDKYDNGSYTAYYNITGELQAKEHIMPGGLEIHVGNNEPTQHAIVVSSKDGPVSYINSVDSYKIPGVSKNGNQVSINFDLGIGGDMSKLPSSGTYYRFIPEASGKMKFKFEAKSMNYYRWDLPGNATYYNTDWGGDWPALNDRPNEQTVNAPCPYYLVRIYLDKEDGQKKVQVTNLGSINNGGDYTSNEISVVAGDEYYLFGGWNQTGLYYNSSWKTPDISDDDRNNDANGSKVYNNIEFRPFDGRTVGCGVAELLWVEFKRNDEIYPLAKWVPNGTTAVNDVNKNNSERHGVPNPDTYVMEYELANIVGFTNYDNNITVKKMSGNITECHPYIVRDANDQTKGKLMIDGIKFAKDQNPGGTILIKIGNPSERTDPLYALTIAYSTDPKYDKKVSESKTIRGHIWDFYTNSLNGLQWTNSTANGAEVKEMGTYFNNYYGQSIANYSSAAEVQTGLNKNQNSFLYHEVHDEDKGDWIFNYNLVYDGNLYDPIFTNKYDMEGDNADMIWDTEGTVFQTSANQSGIFNEYGKTVEHTSSETADPNRYVGILKGGKFRIPWLRKDDRVIIWMGSGTGRTEDFVNFKITNARDALYNPIYCEYDSENDVWNYDEYKVGGSQWNGKDGDPNYGGCYHFFATGWPNDPSKPADMIFEMTGGELCKIYKIQIYRGDRIITNEIKGATSDDKFLLWSRAADPNEDLSETNKDYTDNTRHDWTLQYFGKEQRLADGKRGNTVQTEQLLPNQNNEIIAQTGKYNSATPALTNNRVDPEDNNSEVVSFTYQNQFGEIGTFRIRGKDMEKNRNYVADYADHNVTIAYQETMKYPYTWDFKDMVAYSKNAFIAEDAIEPKTMPEWFDDENTWKNSYEFSSADLSLWKIDTQDQNSYYLRLNSQEQTVRNPMESDNIFETAMGVGGNQLWAKDAVVPETKGLWFYTDDNLANNGDLIIYNKNNEGGMQMNGNVNWAHKLVVPNVPANAAVYLRMEESTNYPTFSFVGDNSNCEVVQPQVVEDGSGDYILAVLNQDSKKRNLVFSLGGYELKKLAVSEDPKTVNVKGWASESRNRVIDHRLTSFFTGKPIKAYTATEFNSSDKTIKLVEITKPMPAALKEGDNAACVLFNTAAKQYQTDTSYNGGEVKVLDNGFHLFVPDMHDYKGDPNNPSGNLSITSGDNGAMTNHGNELESLTGNMMMSFNTGGTENKTLAATSGTGDDIYQNFVLNYKYYKLNQAGEVISNESAAQNEAFYRVAKPGASMKPNSAYIHFLKSSLNNGAKVSFFFGDDLFGEINNGIATGISEVNEENGVNGKAEWYSLDGQKLNGVPTAKGLYIVNGKKVLVK